MTHPSEILPLRVLRSLQATTRPRREASKLIEQWLATKPSAKKSRADVIPIQPEPSQTLLVYFDGKTAVSRLWDEGDTGRCKLCQVCRASNNNCLVVVGRTVSSADAPMLSTVGMVAVAKPEPDELDEL